MKKDELLAELNVKSFFFNEEHGPAIYLSLDGDKYTLDQVRKYAAALDGLISDEPNLHINRENADYKYLIMLSEKQGDGIALTSLSGMQIDYNEVLAKKGANEKVKLIFNLFNVRVQRTEPELLKIRSQKNFDADAAVTGEEDYFITIKVPVGSKTFSVLSDDHYTEGPAGFDGLAPDVALAATAKWREDQEKKK